MKETRDSRLPMGSSDPVSFKCTCSANDDPSSGLVLLFYRYFSAPPSLQPPGTNSSSELAAFHTRLTNELHLGGKIRVGVEGFNITVGGTKNEIEAYITACISHWSFEGLHLDDSETQNAFFKPTSGGCACVFGGSPASVRVTTEITPMGVTNYIPQNWDIIDSLEPADFHEECWKDEQKILVDVRNHYESRIGYFVDPVSGAKAITPEIRRFSQWPQYVKSHKKEFENGASTPGQGRRIMTYCTGGIRCEKGVRWMADELDTREGDKICTLRGGIAAYLTWMDKEIKHGRKRPDESLFRGKNYVFDGRGSTGLMEVKEELEPVSSCHICNKPSDRLSKCRSQTCHLILVICSQCEDTKDPRCCQSCLDLDTRSKDNQAIAANRPNPICLCEMEREARLWGDTIRPQRTQGWKKGSRQAGGMNIRIKTLD